MSNHLSNQTSPYLLQHKDNPVDWYPWGDEAFQKAEEEDKPIFLSIGYSTCHWCHVMAHESFEDKKIAEYLNQYFVSIKVDKEERPDIDSIYMTFCQAFTGSGGWPMSIFMTPTQQPFFAGTYFSNKPRYVMKSFLEILKIIVDHWQNNRKNLLQSARDVVLMVKNDSSGGNEDQCLVDQQKLLEYADQIFRQNFDRTNGGFGRAPKFPTPHKLIYLLARYKKTGDWSQLEMVEKTLVQMYRGGLFDHIGYGFSRYSTDEIFLAPHFEKMLYDNALLLFAFSLVYKVTKKELYRSIANQTADYILNEMTDRDGGFYCAQDADIKGQEGIYYLFTPEEIKQVLGEVEGDKFNEWYDITNSGNFEGKNIPNLLKNDKYQENLSYPRQILLQYRRQRYQLHLDDKILTSWNGLMIGALCCLYRVTKEVKYLDAAKCAQKFIEDNLSFQSGLYVSYRDGNKGQKGFLDDYANEIFALLCLYDATLESEYAQQAEKLCQKVISDFWDQEHGGFYLYGQEHESLILRPKETYDGAIPSGNSMMAYNLVRLCLMAEDDQIELIQIKDKQLKFLSAEAKGEPSNYTMFLIALSQELDHLEKIVVVPETNAQEQLKRELPLKVSMDCIVRILPGKINGFRLKNEKTTYYVCKGHQCLAGSNSYE